MPGQVRKWGVRLATSTGLTAGGLLAQAAYVVGRDLPTQEGVPGSGTVPGSVAGPAIAVSAVGDSSLTGPGLDATADIWLHQAISLCRPLHPVVVHSWAVGGSCADDVVNEQLDRVEPAGIGVVSVGANDVIRGTTVRSYRSAVAHILERMSQLCETVVVLGPPPVGIIPRVPAGLAQVLNLRSRRFHRAAQRAAVAAGGLYVDTFATKHEFAAAGPRWFAPDWFHLNRVGHHRIARAAAPLMQPQLRTPPGAASS